MFGELERVPLREIWPHEEHDFTPWLADNLHHLSKTVNMPLALDRIEASLDNLRVDILARNPVTNIPVLIENQVGKSDHRHLGQIVTYTAIVEEVTLIWVAEQFTLEHKKAVQWLTKFGVQFYCVELSMYRIGQSEVAPHFSLVSSPFLTGHHKTFTLDSKTKSIGHGFKIPAIPGVSQATIERVILARLSGLKWRDIPGNYSQTIKPVRDAWERVHGTDDKQAIS